VKILQDREGPNGEPLPRGHRQALNADIATHSVVIDATARRIWVSRYPNTAGGYVAFDLEEGLSGQLNPVQVVPARDTHLTFDVQRGRDLLRAARKAPPEQAETMARRALGLMPGHPEALQVLAAAFLAQNRPAEAIPLIRQALDAPPEHPREARELEAMLAEAQP